MDPKFHLAAFTANVAASQTDSVLTPCADPYLTQSGSQNAYLLPENLRVTAAFAAGLGVTRARLNVPSLRALVQPNIHPVNKALYPVDDAPVNKLGMRGPRILQAESFQALVTTDATVGPNQSHVLCWLSEGSNPPPAGDFTTMRATASVTAVTGSWVLGTMAFEQDLPPGRYALIGADVIASNVLAVRFRFPGGGKCPGVLAQQAAGEFFLDTFRYGSMGVFGTFQNTAIPPIDVLGISGAASITLFLDLVKVG